MARMHEKPSEEEVSAMRTAFLYEVRPDRYLERVGWTAFLVAIALALMTIYRDSAFYIDLLAPVTGWHARNPAGSLYLEVWATILANAFQIAFGAWAAWLLILGVGRILFARTFVRTCFTLGIAFGITAAALPALITFVFSWLIEKYPVLAS